MANLLTSQPASHRPLPILLSELTALSIQLENVESVYSQGQVLPTRVLDASPDLSNGAMDEILERTRQLIARRR